MAVLPVRFTVKSVVVYAVGIAMMAGAAPDMCLQDAIPASARKQLRTASDSYPLGVWVNDWPAGKAVATLMVIMFEEVLGYVTEFKGLGPATIDGFFALTGCRDPMNSTARGCDDVTHTLVHVNVEGWTIGYPTVWDMIQREYPRTAPKNLGNAGYNGEGGSYIFSKLQETALESEGLSLEFYREYNISWKDPSRYFADLDEVNSSRLSLCSATVLMDKAQMGRYANVTGDEDGVIFEGDGVIGKCWHDHFWLSPACRKQQARCVPFFTGGSGWGLGEQMEKVTFFNMPFAMAVAKDSDNYASLPSDFNSVFYWFVPDTTFLRMKPILLQYPGHDRLAWQEGDRRSQGAAMSIDTHVSQDLHILAPDVEDLAGSYQLGLQDVEEMMLDKLDSKDSDRDVACRWLKANSERWQKWLPDTTKCFAQFGMFDKVTKRFLPDRAAATVAVSNIECRACPAGYFSEALTDARGTTFVCKMCPPGTSQASAAATSCDPCPRGEYAGGNGSQACLRCDSGTYQDEVGKSECLVCPEGTSTLGRGGLSALDCGCLPGTIDTATPDNSSLDNVTDGAAAMFRCEPCNEGLECPFGSSVQGLVRGEPGASGEAAPQIRGGYTSRVESATSIFKCKPAHICPGGKPGTCAGELQGDLCNRCAIGEHGEKCFQCQVFDSILWSLLGSVALLLTWRAYFWVNGPVQNNASKFQLFLMSVGLLIHTIQSIAVFGMMNVKWPSILTNTSGGLQLVLLDISSTNLTCLSGWRDWIRFTLSAAAFPLLIVWLLLCWVLSRCLAKTRFLKRWILSHTVNTIGTFLQAGFASVCAIGFKPMMCYRHPNGAQSLLKYPGTFCGSTEQATMLVVGVVLLLIGLGFGVSCVVASWSLPKWSVNKETHYVQAFRFFTGKYRLDSYWFGLMPMIRGFAFSFIIVLGTNAPRAQTTCASAVLLAYFAVQVGWWPWKARVINIADLLLNALLLLLINQSTQELNELEQQFAAGAALVIMLLLLVCAAGLILSNIFMALKEVNATGTRADGPSNLSQALKDTAEKLMEVDIVELDGKVMRLNYYDMEALEVALTVVSSDLQIGDAHFRSRMVQSTMNEKLRASIVQQPIAPSDTSAVDNGMNLVQVHTVSPADAVEDGPPTGPEEKLRASMVQQPIAPSDTSAIDNGMNLMEEHSGTKNMSESIAVLPAQNTQELDFEATSRAIGIVTEGKVVSAEL